MGFRVSTNTASMAAQRTLSNHSRETTRVYGQLSSGDRITETCVDPAGLAISEKMKASIRSFGQTIKNTSDAASLFQVAEGNLSVIGDMGIRLRELAVQAASDTLGNSERRNINLEFQSLKNEIERLAENSEFSGHKLLNGTGAIYDFQVGINNGNSERISFNTKDLDSRLSSLAIAHTSVITKENAQESLGQLDNMITKVSNRKSVIGARMMRLQTAEGNNDNSRVNASASNSRIRDADVAQTSAEAMKLKISTAATVSTLSLANDTPNQVMKLLS